MRGVAGNEIFTGSGFEMSLRATTIFDPTPDAATKSGFCYFIYSTGSCPPNSFNATLSSAKKPHEGDTYGPYFVANWVTGTGATPTVMVALSLRIGVNTYSARNSCPVDRDRAATTAGTNASTLATMSTPATSVTSTSTGTTETGTAPRLAANARHTT
jgi:hypothetical protein